MKNTITRTLTSLGLALALTTLASTVQAETVNYSFSVTTDTPVGVYGQNFSGTFSYEDTQAPTQGISGEDLYTLTSFTFNFNGTPYEVGHLVDNFAAFEAGQFIGLEVSSDTFGFLPALGLFDASFAFELGEDNGRFGSVSYVAGDPNPNNVPEPATGALLAVGLLAAAARRKVGVR